MNEEQKPDPRRLLEMALDGLKAEAGHKSPPPETDELVAAFPQFEILGLLGRGGMASVYRVRQKKLDRQVALKVLDRQLAAEPDFEERFLREAKALAGLEHPNLLTVHDFGESKGFYYLVTELVDGTDLRQLLDMGRLSPPEALKLVPQICDALQHAHSMGVVHRDIKPANILVDQEGRVRLADFGLAKLVDDANADITLTRSEQTLGTLKYMAPEQLQAAKNVDHRADIYALGVVIYEMLTGQLPIGAFEPPSRMAKVSTAVDDVVLRALATAVEHRYQSAGELKSAVESVRDAKGPRAARPRSAESRLCRLPLLALALVFVLLVGGAVVLKLSVDDARVWNQTVAQWRRDEAQYENQMAKIRLFEAGGKVWQGERPSKPQKPKILGDPESQSLVMPWYLLGMGSIALCILLMYAGFSSITRIKRSQGRLHGLGLAVVTGWLPPLCLVNALLCVPLGSIRDRDVQGIAIPLIVILLLVLDVFFLRWQQRRHASEIA